MHYAEKTTVSAVLAEMSKAEHRMEGARIAMALARHHTRMAIAHSLTRGSNIAGDVRTQQLVAFEKRIDNLHQDMIAWRREKT